MKVDESCVFPSLSRDDLNELLADCGTEGQFRLSHRLAARMAICHLYGPLPTPYYDFVLREQGFAAVADACARHVPEGRIERAAEAVSDEVLDAVAVAGTLAECRAGLARFAGVVDQALMFNVGHGSAAQDTLMNSFRDLIRLGSG